MTNNYTYTFSWNLDDLILMFKFFREYKTTKAFLKGHIKIITKKYPLIKIIPSFTLCNIRNHKFFCKGNEKLNATVNKFQLFLGKYVKT